MGSRRRYVLTIHVLQAGSFAAQSSQIVQLGAAHLRRAHQFDLVDHLGVQRENTLDALAEAHLAHSEAGLRAACCAR